MVIVTESPLTTQTKTDLVIFLLHKIHYAIAIQPIQQIIEMVTITPILKTEAWMEGVINYHGASIPVINLRRHFHQPIAPYGWHTPIILVHIAGRQVGLIVDDVLDVVAIAQEDIIHPRTILPPDIPEAQLLQGLVQAPDHVTLLLDLEHLFDQTQVRALSAATSALSETAPEPVSASPSPAETMTKTAKKKAGQAAKGKAKPAAAPPSVDSADPDIQTA